MQRPFLDSVLVWSLDATRIDAAQQIKDYYSINRGLPPTASEVVTFNLPAALSSKLRTIPLYKRSKLWSRKTAFGFFMVDFGAPMPVENVDSNALERPFLSVIMPVFNESATLEAVVDRIEKCGIRCELIIVDDGSSDSTPEILAQWTGDQNKTLVRHDRNQGKGAALRTAFAYVRGEVVIIQDADLEYDPSDYQALIEPIVDQSADVVYGRRVYASGKADGSSWHRWANRIITFASNCRTRLRLSDVETCYKVFRCDILETIAPTLRENGFGIELEITAKLAKIPTIRVVERDIQYEPRTYAQGKKIRVKDAIVAFWCILRY